jgi:short-subunit dehydrogenase
MQLRSAHVLVVGATGGLGGSLARALAAAGAKLSLSGRDPVRLAALAAELEPAVLGTTCVDLVQGDAPAQIVADAVSAAPLDAVVCAAGVVAFGSVEELDDDVFDELLLVNLIAPVRLLRAAAAVLPRGGVVVQLSAVVAETPLPGMAAYAASKAALTAFDRAAARELRRKGVRVLDVRPGHTETDLASHPIAGTAPKLGNGLAPKHVAERILRAMSEDAGDLPSSEF